MVLVGGRSRRFGTDKLRHRLETGEWLVDRPIAAMRSVFGPRVFAVGNCAAEVAARADAHEPDAFPGAGPMGGVLSALRSADGPVCVAPGDVPRLSSGTIRALLAGAAEATTHLCVMAVTDRLEPCCAIYFEAARARLEELVSSGALRLRDAFDAGERLEVGVNAEELVNVNRPRDVRECDS